MISAYLRDLITYYLSNGTKGFKVVIRSLLRQGGLSDPRYILVMGYHSILRPPSIIYRKGAVFLGKQSLICEYLLLSRRLTHNSPKS